MGSPWEEGASDAELDAVLKEFVVLNSVESRRIALETLLTITSNIVKSPYEWKFRKIKRSNPVFSKRVAACNGGEELLVAAGWLPDVTPCGEDVWMLGDMTERQVAQKRRFEEELAKLPRP